MIENIYCSQTQLAEHWQVLSASKNFRLVLNELSSLRAEAYIALFQLCAGAFMDITHFNQKQLANRWDVSEGTLERWRSEGIRPVFFKLKGQVRYRLVDIEAFEESCLVSSKKSVFKAMAQNSVRSFG
ncbi:MAG: helix-turn-helix domain-containing protein [Burkholderiaceae bacterium]